LGGLAFFFRFCFFLAFLASGDSAMAPLTSLDSSGAPPARASYTRSVLSSSSATTKRVPSTETAPDASQAPSNTTTRPAGSRSRGPLAKHPLAVIHHKMTAPGAHREITAS
jgi:hypothetical protein